MHPILFQVGNFPVRSYGVILMIGVAIAAFIAAKRAPRFGLKSDVLWDSLLWMIIPGILGARGVYMATHWSEFAGKADRIFTLQFNGLTSFGGMIFGFFGLLIYLKLKKVPFWPMMDTVGVPALIAHAIGRIACLFNGCCFGYPCTGGHCVHVEGHQGTFFPAQGLDTVVCLILAALLFMAEKRSLKVGVSFNLCMIAYGLSRFIFEFWRAGPFDRDSGAYLPDLLGSTPLTKAQWMSLVLVLVGAGLVAYRLKVGQADIQDRGSASP